MNNKLEKVISTKADALVTDCPGCIMQLSGTISKQRKNIDVFHIAELLKKSQG